MIRVFRPIPVENLKLLVFDLDGTLIDSAQDLCNSVNAALGEFRLGPLPDPAIAGFVGNGAPMLMRRALALAGGLDPGQVDEEIFSKAYAFFLQYYREHKLDFTYAYEGVLEALQALHELHDAPGGPLRTMAVLTNKPVRFSEEILNGLGLSRYFQFVYGGNSFERKKPDPMGVEIILRDFAAAPSDAMMVGDSDVDVRTARNSGIWACGVSYGLGTESLRLHPPDIMLDSLDELPGHLNGDVA